MSTELQPPPAEAAEDAELATQTAATAAPEVIADTFGEYVKIWWARVRGGESGALPVILGLVAVGPLAQFDAESIVDLMTTGTSKRLAAVPAEPSSGSSSGH